MKLSHLNENGEANMVDVSGKAATERLAVAESRVRMSRPCFEAVKAGQLKKGDVFSVARIAGIQAAKQTASLIPLCHPLLLTGIDVQLELDEALPGIRVQARCRLAGKTGVEMEALTAASVAALTVYDMCKAVDKGIVIESTRLLEKQGGKSGEWRA